MFHRLLKPWFLYRPQQLLRRAFVEVFQPPRGYRALQTSWGIKVIADPSRAIGRSILTIGLYDLAVSEVLARLIAPGDTVVDAGANIGYMTLLAGVAAGSSGRILAFEPHPELFKVLQRNVITVGNQLNLNIFETYQVALGDRAGIAELILPPDFEQNDGKARIGQTTSTERRSITVQTVTLDDLLGDASIALLKLDVEEFEPQVLRGAARLLRQQQIEHIVFEDYLITDSETAHLLREAGYHLFSLGWSLRRLRVEPVEVGSLATRYEAPSFIATLAPNEVLNRCRPEGWQVLNRNLANQH